MALAKFMASPMGRGVRIVLGIALIVLGLAVVGDTAGLILTAVGVVPILAGVFNVCLIGPIIGAPLSGKDLA